MTAGGTIRQHRRQPPPFTEHRLPSSTGANISTWDLGGAGPALVFLHATGFHGRCYGPLAGELAGRFHCWAVDFAGHGASEPYPDGDYSWSRFRDDLLAVLEALDLGAAHAFGHSLGGAVALLAEAAAPGTFRDMYLWEPIVIGPSFLPSGGHRDLSHVARRRRPRFHSAADAVVNYAGKRPFSRLRADTLLAYVEGGVRTAADGGVALACSPETEARVYEAALAASTPDILPKVTVPVRLACGGVQPDIGQDHLERVASLLPSASVEVIDVLGHLGPMECPQLVAARVAGVLPAAGCP